MKIENLIQLLDNRLREFKLSKDYARMNGDLERMNAADKEIIALDNTLFQLNLLVDTSKSAAVKNAILAEVMTDGSVAVLGEYDISPYATNPLHEEKIMNILSKMGVMDTVEKIDDYIGSKYWSSPVTGEMIMSAAEAYIVDVRLMMAIMEQDSRFGTAGKAVRTLNPGNVGNDDSGNTRTYESWQEGVTAVAEWLNRHRGSTIIPEIPEETVAEPTATSTSSQPSPEATAGEAGQATSTLATATTTPATATTTPVTAGSASSPQATSTPETIPVTTSTTTTTTATSTPATATSTPVTATSTPATATSTPATATTTPATATTTPETIPIITSTTATATTTPVTTSSSEETATSTSSGQATSTPSVITPTATSIPVITTSTTTTATSTPVTATSTPVTATSTPETIPIITSTTATSTSSGQATSTAN